VDEEKKLCGHCGGDDSAWHAVTPKANLAEYLEQDEMSRRLDAIANKILVLSGKGGVGKSTVACHLAQALAVEGNRVGLLDVDIHGPSVPVLLGLGRQQVVTHGERIIPVECRGMKVMSIGFLLPDAASPVIWRGPMKMSLIRQFLKDVDWGSLDYLIIDCPPGTGDEPLSVAQLIGRSVGAIVVTTPQEVALQDVRKSIAFCRQLEIPLLGVVENMSGFVCPHCGETSDIFSRGGGERLAEEMQVSLLGRIPIEPALVAAGDAGRPLAVQDAAADAFGKIVQAILAASGPQEGEPSLDGGYASNRKEGTMRIGIPVANGLVCAHFGHCDEFALVDVDSEKKEIVGTTTVPSPEHQPGLLPGWLRERGADLVIAGGMGQRAQELFAEQGVEVVVGAPPEPPETVVRAYLSGTLITGANVCDH
jgi:ATP-binding protein involved in chromosome partitioning